MAKMIQCPKCGKPYYSSLRMCPECMTPRPKNTKKTIAIVVACFAALVIIGVLGNLLGETENTSSSGSTGETSSVVQTGGNAVSEQPKETKEEYIASCQEIDYKTLARSPEEYTGKRIKVKIEVSQVLSSGFLKSGGYRGYEDYEFNVMEDGSTFMEKEWFIEHDPNTEPRVLENDVIVVYGEYAGVKELERVLTNTKEYVPVLTGKYIEIITE